MEEEEGAAHQRSLSSGGELEGGLQIQSEGVNSLSLQKNGLGPKDAGDLAGEYFYLQTCLDISRKRVSSGDSA